VNEKLRQARLDRSWSQEKAAAECKVSRTTYIRWEHEGQSPHGYNLTEACQAFKMTAYQLGFAKAPSPSIQQFSARTREIEETRQNETVSLTTFRQHPVPEETDEQIPSIDTDLFTISIMALVLHQQQTQGDVDELSLSVKQALEENVPHMHRGQDVSRREALKFIVHVPLAIYGLTRASNLSSSLVPEEVLPLYAAGIPACWRFYYEGGQSELEHVLPGYLSQLTMLAQISSKHQKNAASLLSQAHQLKALLVQEHENFGEAIEQCRQAFIYGQLAEDPNLQAMALIRKQDTLHENKRFSQWLHTLKEAETFAETITPLLRGRIYARLAVAYARHSQSQLAQRYIGLAQDTFPEHPETDLSFYYNHTTHFVLYANKALTWLRLNQPKEAWEAVTIAGKFVPGLMNPRKIDLTLYQIQVAMAMGNLELSCDLFKDLIMFTRKFGREIDIGNAHDIYQQLCVAWPHEKRVQNLEEYLH